MNPRHFSWALVTMMIYHLVVFNFPMKDFFLLIVSFFLVQENKKKESKCGGKRATRWPWSILSEIIKVVKESWKILLGQIFIPNSSLVEEGCHHESPNYFQRWWHLLEWKEPEAQVSLSTHKINIHVSILCLWKLDLLQIWPFLSK